MEASLLPHFDPTVRKQTLGRQEKKWDSELQSFFNCATRCAGSMETSMRANALGTWLTKTHEMRNAAASIGARKLAGFCNEAEQLRNLRSDSAKALLYHIDKEIAYLRSHIN